MSLRCSQQKKSLATAWDALPISRVQCYHPSIYIRIFIHGLRHHQPIGFFIFVST